MNSNHAPTIWGILDLSFIAWYVVGSLLEGRVPIYSDLQLAVAMAASFGNIMPTVVPGLGGLLYISIVFSGTLLWRKSHAGVAIAYAQFPFRLILTTPSLFFLPWLFIPLHLDQQTAVVSLVVLIGSSEILKVWSLWRWRKKIYAG